MVNSKRFLTPKKRGGSKGSRKRMRGGNVESPAVGDIVTKDDLFYVIRKIDGSNAVTLTHGETDQEIQASLEDIKKNFSDPESPQQIPGSVLAKSAAAKSAAAASLPPENPPQAVPSSLTSARVMVNIQELKDESFMTTLKQLAKGDDNKDGLSKREFETLERFKTLPDSFFVTLKISDSDRSNGQSFEILKDMTRSYNRDLIKKKSDEDEEELIDINGLITMLESMTVVPSRVVGKTPAEQIVNSEGWFLPPAPVQSSPEPVKSLSTLAYERVQNELKRHQDFKRETQVKKTIGKLEKKNQPLHNAFTDLDVNNSLKLDKVELLTQANDQKFQTLIQELFEDHSINKDGIDPSLMTTMAENLVTVFDYDNNGVVSEEELINNQNTLLSRVDTIPYTISEIDSKMWVPDETPPERSPWIGVNAQIGDYFDATATQQVSWVEGKMIDAKDANNISNNLYLKVPTIKKKLNSLKDNKRGNLDKVLKEIVFDLATVFSLSDDTQKKISDHLKIHKKVIPGNDKKHTISPSWNDIDSALYSVQITELFPEILAYKSPKSGTSPNSGENSPQSLETLYELKHEPFDYKFTTSTNPKFFPAEPTKFVSSDVKTDYFSKGYYHLYKKSNLSGPQKVNSDDIPEFEGKLIAACTRFIQSLDINKKKQITDIFSSGPNGPQLADKIIQIYRYENFKTLIGKALDLTVQTDKPTIKLAADVLQNLVSSSVSITGKGEQGDLGSIFTRITSDPKNFDETKKIMIKPRQFSTAFEQALITKAGDSTELVSLIKFVGLLVCDLPRNSSREGRFFSGVQGNKKSGEAFKLGHFKKRFAQALIVLYNMTHNLYVPDSVCGKNFRNNFREEIPSILKQSVNSLSGVVENIKSIYDNLKRIFYTDINKEPQDTDDSRFFGLLSMLLLHKLNPTLNLSDIVGRPSPPISMFGSPAISMFGSISNLEDSYKRLFKAWENTRQADIDSEIYTIKTLIPGSPETNQTKQGRDDIRKKLYLDLIFGHEKPFMQTEEIDLLNLVKDTDETAGKMVLKDTKEGIEETVPTRLYNDNTMCVDIPTDKFTKITGGKNSKKRKSKVVNSKKRQSTSQQKQTPKRKTAQQQSKTKSKSPQQQQQQQQQQKQQQQQQQQKKQQQKKQQQKQSQHKKNTQAQKKSSKNGKK